MALPGAAILEGIWQDLKYGWRTLRRSPTFALVAILTLAIGIGANVAIFSIVRGVLLRPLPYPHSDRIVILWETDQNRNVSRGVVSPAELLDWRDTNHSFVQLSGWRALFFNLTGSGEPEQMWGSQVTGNFFRLLGVAPMLGRDFQPEDEQPGHGQVALLSWDLWQRHFDGSRGVLGKTIMLDDHSYQVIGVLPRGFSLFGTKPNLEIWTPFTWTRAQLDREDHQVIVFGRLRPGVSIRQSQAEMEAIHAQLKKQYPAFDQKVGIHVVGFQDDLTDSIHPALLILSFAVIFVFLIACANVANLLLARAAGREREIAVRSAIGAGRRRILSQLLTESVLLGLIGGALGIAVAYGGVRLLQSALPASGRGQIPYSGRIEIDLPVLGFALLLSLVAAIAFGLAPAIQISRDELSESLKEGSRGSTSGRRGQFLRSALVVSEIALSLMLLAGAGLLIHSFVLMLLETPGFDSANLLTMQTYLSDAHYPNIQRVANFYQQAMDRIAALPGVQSASAADFLPLSGWRVYCDFDIAGRPHPPSGEHFTSQYRVADYRYFHTMGMTLKSGRDFAISDGPTAPGVAIINESLARRYWPDSDPIGQHIQLDFGSVLTPWDAQPRPGWITIIGVIGDVHEWQWNESTFGQVYLPVAQNPSRMMSFAVRSRTNPAHLTAAVKGVIESLDPDQPVTAVRTMDEYLSDALSQRRLSMLLLALFAGVATLLAGIGIYGVMAYAVSQRSHEIGIRMALGAAPADVLRMIVGDGMRLAAIGLILGVAGSFLVLRYLKSQLYGIRATDPLTLVTVAFVLAIVAIAACYFPARRATKVDPLVALRYE